MLALVQLSRVPVFLQFPDKFKLEKFSSHPTCHTYDIDAVERAFMRTELFQMIERYPNVRALNKPSLNDGALNGTYCSSYNHRVRTQGLSIWGRPGGRSARSHVGESCAALATRLLRAGWRVVLRLPTLFLNLPTRTSQTAPLRIKYRSADTT